MPLHETQVGRDGRKPERSAISGRVLGPEDVYFTVNGNTLGVKAVEWRTSSQAEKAALKATWVSDLPQQAVPALDTPNYDAMSLDELKAEASAQNVDISGKRSKEDIKQALLAAAVTRRFAPTEAPAIGVPLDGRPLDVGSIQGD